MTTRFVSSFGIWLISDVILSFSLVIALSFFFAVAIIVGFNVREGVKIVVLMGKGSDCG
jgi:hypothetical protein